MIKESMKTNNYKSRLTTILVLILFTTSIVSCSTQRASKSKPQNTSIDSETRIPSKPPAIDVILKYEDWIITSHRILNYSPTLGQFRKAGMYLYGKQLVMKLKSNRFDNVYWLVEIPSVSSGTHEVRAIPYWEQEVDIRPLDSPPDGMEGVVFIKNMTIDNFFFQEYKEAWGEFKLYKVKKGILLLKNKWYLGTLWGARLPKEDGEWTLKFQILK